MKYILLYADQAIKLVKRAICERTPDRTIDDYSDFLAWVLAPKRVIFGNHRNYGDDGQIEIFYYQNRLENLIATLTLIIYPKSPLNLIAELELTSVFVNSKKKQVKCSDLIEYMCFDNASITEDTVIFKLVDNQIVKT